MKDKTHFNKLTSMHVNSKLMEEVTKKAKKENKYFYEKVDELLKEYLKE